MSEVRERIEGVVIGLFLGFGDDGPLVVFPGNPTDVAVVARSLAELTPEMIGTEVALLFQDGEPERPLIIGRIVEPWRKTQPQTTRENDNIRIVANERVEIRCGKATLIMEKDGRITMRGTYLTSHASAANRIRGGSVNLN